MLQVNARRLTAELTLQDQRCHIFDQSPEIERQRHYLLSRTVLGLVQGTRVGRRNLSTDQRSCIARWTSVMAEGI